MRDPDFERAQALEAAFGQRKLSHYVGPFYLKLMGFNAADAPDDLIAKVRRRSRTLSATDISQLLQMQWRPRVMGAWYAIAAQDPSLSAAVHGSLETCQGHLTSPPLITAALAYPTPQTPRLLADYIEQDQRMQWGAAGLAAAALARVGAKDEERLNPAYAFSPEDSSLLDNLTAVGRALRSG